MDFEKKIPDWNAEGAEPPESLKTSGFQGGYRPPASIFNWFWHSVSACLKEIREKLSNVDNTSDAEKIVKYAQESGTAGKVKNAFTLQLNGGSTEGTNKFTFDASAQKTANITPSGIGAAAATHNHSASDITSGTLPVARGGTGVTSNPSMLTNLGSTTAASMFAASPRPGVTGTLPVSNGGTGATDAATARSNIGAAAATHKHSASDIDSGVLPVTRGGTGSNAVDSEPTEGSTNMVTSGGVYTALTNMDMSGHKHSASDITSGTLPVSRGGTGNTSVDTTPTSGSTKMVTSGGVYSALAGKAPSSHIHAASTITAGTLAGRVQGNASAMATLGNAQLRDIKAGTSDLTAGSSTLATGTLYFVYE